MAIPAGVVRFSILGTFPQGEIFDWSVWGLPQADPDQNGLFEMANGLALYLTGSGGTNIRVLVPADTEYTEVRAYFYGNGGGQATLVATAPVNAAGTGTTASAPLQQCLVATLLTGIPGRSHRGRVYIPTTAGLSVNDHQAGTSTINGLATAVAGLLTAMAAPTGDIPPATPVVVSSVLSTTTPVTSVRVDSRFDVQRRRANRQAALRAGMANV